MKLITAKDKSFMDKTKGSRPKQIIHFKNKLLMAKTKVLISGFWSVAFQVTGATLHDMSTISIFKFLLACLLLLFFYEIAKWSMTGLHNPLCSFGDQALHNSLIDFWSNKHILQRFTSFVWYDQRFQINSRFQNRLILYEAPLFHQYQ